MLAYKIMGIYLKNSLQKECQIKVPGGKCSDPGTMPNRLVPYVGTVPRCQIVTVTYLFKGID
jgi:hypothetical protein